MNSDALLPLTDAKLLERISTRDWFVEAQRKRIEAELDQLRLAMDRFDAERLATVRDTSELLARLQRILAGQVSAVPTDCARLAACAGTVKNDLAEARRRFLRGPYRRLMPSSEIISGCDDVGQLREALVTRFDTVTEPDTQQCLETLARLIKRCQSAVRGELSGQQHSSAKNESKRQGDAVSSGPKSGNHGRCV